MTTREEIEAAERIANATSEDGFISSYPDDSEFDYGVDVDIVVEAVLRSKTERAERQRRIEAAAKDIEQATTQILLRNGVDMRKHRIVIANEMAEIITRCLDGETT